MPSPDALHDRALESLNAKDFPRAIDLFTQAIALNGSAARYFVNRAQAYRALNDEQHAIDDLRRAIQLDPKNAIAHHNLGVALRAIGKTEDAIASYREAVRLKPDYAKAHYNLGKALRVSNQLVEAEKSYRAAIAAQPNYPEAWNNLGELLEETRRVDDSLAAFNRAIELKPDHAGAHFNRGFLHLLRGEYESGWKDYEWRFRTQSIAPFSTTIPQWRGEDLQGKSLLLVAEQGAGDSIQFVRYASELAVRGANVIVRCHRNLAELMQTVPGVSRVVADDEPIPSVDFYIPMLSVPGILGILPANVPYIFPDSTRVERWRDLIAPHRGKLNIGIAWAGNPQQKNDRNRSAPLSALLPLGGFADATLFSLQKGVPTSQIETSGLNLIDLTNHIHDFSDTAALIANLDVVVSVCTSVAHVAGAMGKPTLAMLCFNADWRWLLDREDSPWYPTMKLFRQKLPGDWTDVARRVRSELEKQNTNRHESSRIF